MPDYAPNFTARYKLRYFANGKNHTQLWRPAPGQTIADASTFALFISGYYAAVAGLLYDDTAPIDASWAEQDSDVFLPCAIPTIVGTGDTGPAPVQLQPVALSLVGRSTAGLRWAIYQYGSTIGPETFLTANNYRVTSAEATEVDDVTAFLNGESGTFRANDGVAVLVKPYLNVKANDYWVRKARG